MSNEHYPYLCGGILLNLLIEAKKTSITSREKLNGKKSSVSDADILKGLIKLVTGEEVIASSATLKKDTSEYKKCNINGTSIITFTEASTLEIFKNRYTYNWKKLIDDGVEFVNKYLSESKLEWLTKAIFEIILTDSTISENTTFGTSFFNKVNKINLKYVNTIEIEIFLINVLIYIITMKPYNTFGKNTFKKYYKQNNRRAVWKLDYPIGQTITQHIKIKKLDKKEITTRCLDIKLSNEQPLNSTKTNKVVNFKDCNDKITCDNFDYNYFDNTQLYNLIVGGIENAIFKNEEKTYGSFIIKKERVLNLWCDELVKPLSKLGTKEREILTSLPTIFAVDQGPSGHKEGDFSYFGFVRKIHVLGENVKIVFEIYSSFNQYELYKNNFELCIEDFELYTTHWAVKQVDLNYELNQSNIIFF